MESRTLQGDTALLIGTANQAGRPISLAKEWAPIAQRLVDEHPEEARLLRRGEYPLSRTKATLRRRATTRTAM